MCVCGGGGVGVVRGVVFCSVGGKMEIYKGPLQTQTIHYLTLIQSGSILTAMSSYLSFTSSLFTISIGLLATQ